MATELACVVVAVDAGEESMRALNWTLDNVPESASIIILHVQPPPSTAVGINPASIPFGGPGMEVPAFAAAVEAHLHQENESILNRALQICVNRNVNVKTQVVIGKPREKICEFVDTIHADLLVMGDRDLGRVQRFFLGSVSKYCKKHASCPVVIIKGDSGEVIRDADILLSP